MSKLLAQIASDLTLEEPTVGRVLVLSPHPDDDAIGCGGTLARHVALGSEVTVLYLTDGSKGALGAPHTEPRLVELREHEARAACRTLGVQNTVFLRRPDGGLRPDQDTIDAVNTVLDDTDPDLVYLPSFFDGFFHVDHLQTNVILDKIVAKQDLGFSCYGYEVYGPLIPNRLVDISAYASTKTRAIERHGTQTGVRAYSKILQLNEYRAALLGPIGCTHAEAFLRANPTTYSEIFRCFFDEHMRENASSRTV